MSENDVRAWRISAATPQELTTEELIERAIRKAFAHGVLQERRGVGSEPAERHKRLVKADRDELIRRARET